MGNVKIVDCRLAVLMYSYTNMHNALQGRIQDFFRRGCSRLLLYFNNNKPHSFFFGRIPVVLENPRSSQGGGCAPPAPSPQIRPCIMIKKCLFKGSVDMEKVVAGRKVTCLPELSQANQLFIYFLTKRGELFTCEEKSWLGKKGRLVQLDHHFVTVGLPCHIFRQVCAIMLMMMMILIIIIDTVTMIINK